MICRLPWQLSSWIDSLLADRPHHLTLNHYDERWGGVFAGIGGGGAVRVEQVRIVPHTRVCGTGAGKTHTTVEVVYEKAAQVAETLNPAFFAGGDMGVDHRVTIPSKKPGFVPVVS